MDDIRLINTLKGSKNKKALSVELENGHKVSFRRALYLNRDLVAGTQIEEKDLVCLRADHGIDAREASNLVGKKALIDLKIYEQLDWQHFTD